MNVKAIRMLNRGISLTIIAGAAWLTGSLAMPMDSHAGACSKSSAGMSGTVNGKNASSQTSATGAFVCISRSEALSTLGLNADEEAGNGISRATICHVPPGNAEAQHTITVGQPSVYAHLAHGDTMGACAGWVSSLYIASLPSCAAIDASGTSLVSGVWLPDTAAADGAAMNSYFAGVKGGTLAGHPDSASYSYREIYGQ